MSTSREMSIPRPVDTTVPRNVSSRPAKSGVKRRVNTGQVFDHALFGLHEPGGDQDGAGRSARYDPFEKGLGVDSDGPEEHRHERREDTAAEGDQDIVDEQLARESNEVHAAR